MLGEKAELVNDEMVTERRRWEISDLRLGLPKAIAEVLQ